jgi:hypothetical protein
MTAPNHPLAAWIESRSSRETFCRAVGCSDSHLSNILAFRKAPSLELAVRIENLTEGEFTAKRLNDLARGDAEASA